MEGVVATNEGLTAEEVHDFIMEGLVATNEGWLAGSVHTNKGRGKMLATSFRRHEALSGGGVVCAMWQRLYHSKFRKDCWVTVQKQFSLCFDLSRFNFPNWMRLDMSPGMGQLWHSTSFCGSHQAKARA